MMSSIRGAGLWNPARFVPMSGLGRTWRHRRRVLCAGSMAGGAVDGGCAECGGNGERRAEWSCRPRAGVVAGWVGVSRSRRVPGGVAFRGQLGRGRADQRLAAHQGRCQACRSAPRPATLLLSRRLRPSRPAARHPDRHRRTAPLRRGPLHGDATRAATSVRVDSHSYRSGDRGRSPHRSH